MQFLRICRPLCHTNRTVQLRFRSATASAVGAGNNILSSDLKPFSEIPGPKGLYTVPYIGAALLFKPFTKYDYTEIRDLADSYKNQYGDIFKLRLGRDYLVYISNPDDAKTVMLANYQEHSRLPFDMSKIFSERTGTPKGLPLLVGDEWARLRKPTQEKMLRPAVVANYVPLIEKVTNDYVDILRKKDKIDDLREEMAKYSTESVGMLCFNRRMGCLENDMSNSLAANVSNSFEVLQESIFTPFKTFMYFRTKLYRRFEKEWKEFQSVAHREIKSQRAFLEDMEKKGELDTYLEKEPNFMYSLLADGRMTDGQINTMINDLFGAGIDSTANTLTFLLTDLALNKDKQQRLYEEIREVIGDSKSLTKEHLAKMSYLKACLKESHRKTFPLPIGSLRILESELAVGGYLLPKNTIVGLNMGSMALDERYFTKPKEFIPERWLRETSGDLTKAHEFPFAVKPFGFGARSCIGQRFAENEIFIAVAKIIQNFEVSVPAGVKEIKTTSKLFTTPSEKVELHLKERK